MTYIILFSRDVVGFICGLLSSIFVARHLGPEIYGSYVFIMLVFAYFQNFGRFRINVSILPYLKNNPEHHEIIFPLAFALLLFIGIFQQSLSVHLMGYSYIFAFLFATGICGLMMHISKYINSINLSIILSIPILVGIVITSIRVSMLTGLNG